MKASPSPFLINSGIGLLFSPTFAGTRNLLLVHFSMSLLSVSAFLSLEYCVISASTSGFCTSRVKAGSSFNLFLILFLSIYTASPYIKCPDLHPGIILTHFFYQLNNLSVSCYPFFIKKGAVGLYYLIRCGP